MLRISNPRTTSPGVVRPKPVRWRDHATVK